MGSCLKVGFSVPSRLSRFSQSHPYSLIKEHASMDEIEKILKDDLELRIPLSNRRIRLFHLERKEDEELSHFVLRVKEHARYVEVDKLPVEEIITLIITSRCNIKQLTDTWALRKKHIRKKMTRKVEKRIKRI